jgi:hypothetical protein
LKRIASTFRFFRFVMVGQNSHDKLQFALHGFEVFGRLITQNCETSTIQQSKMTFLSFIMINRPRFNSVYHDITLPNSRDDEISHRPRHQFHESQSPPKLVQDHLDLTTGKVP